jgi:hypothetical protein
MARPLLALLGLLALAGVQVGVASGRVATDQHTRFEVTQTHTVVYDTATCRKTQVIKLTAISVQFRRHVRARRVPEAHIRAVQRARRCPDTSKVVDFYKFGDVHPKFGCGGRCGRNVTEAVGFYLGWPYVLNNGEPPFVHIATSVRGRVAKRNGPVLGHICTQIDWIGWIGCQSSG